ncbi:hypothetical protein [Nonomuraea sp. NPDC048916]|uniref:hypothetical protein n=1 Tax=Nonomuraea sp. NPDC048916 TaxID=3154232 RepID=UPI0034108F32
MKRMLAATGFVIALAGVPQAAAAGVQARQPIQAASVQAVSAQAVSAQAASAQAAADLPVHRGKFWFHSDCVTAGQQGVDRGHWSQYQCAEGWMWNLWTDR